MVIPKKKSGNEAQGLNQGLMEELLKKSLEISPDLKQGKTTEEALAAYKSQMASSPATQPRSPKQQQTPHTTSTLPTTDEQRRRTIHFFLDEKGAEYQKELGRIQEKIRSLERERKALRKRIMGDIIDFLSLVASRTDQTETRSVLKNYRTLLKELGASEADIFSRTN
ncbi:MAG: hypothetical protein VYA34_05410 [Myxococcota bacterium]|nr:hypothetical protein [Myxococcota bacterium]